jgi:hypothetical protein
MSAVNNEGVTPLSWAAQSPDLLSLCLKHLNASNPEDKSSGTVILQAISANAVSCLKMLLDLGFKVNLSNVFGKTALDSGLELGYSLVIHILLSYEAKPGLRWKVDSEFIQQWGAEEWFPHLIKQIRSTSVHQYVYQFYAYESVEREDEIVVDKSSPDAPYLEATVPTRFDDVRGIVFHFIPHDQGNTPRLEFYGITLVLTCHCIGWSDQKAKWGGSHVDSSSFFEVGCKITMYAIISVSMFMPRANGIPTGKSGM